MLIEGIHKQCDLYGCCFVLLVVVRDRARYRVKVGLCLLYLGVCGHRKQVSIPTHPFTDLLPIRPPFDLGIVVEVGRVQLFPKNPTPNCSISIFVIHPLNVARSPFVFLCFAQSYLLSVQSQAASTMASRAPTIPMPKQRY